VVNPTNEALVDSALIEQVLKQAADWIVGNGRDDRRLESETALEAAGNVVFASAFGNFERAGGRDPAIAGIKPQHYLAEAHPGPTASFFRFYGQCHCASLFIHSRDLSSLPV